MKKYIYAYKVASRRNRIAYCPVVAESKGEAIELVRSLLPEVMGAGYMWLCYEEVEGNPVAELRRWLDRKYTDGWFRLQNNLRKGV